ncbi:MAG: bifunctional phosphoribosyl-AMP cyclohydrolase/phosphoribosyl-ATP diphosphatase HisIE [Flavobacteriales bacterium]|nr:bifunctional phosphoribosyl-AMP cyclohydrolase/phosphoribosyl-ATP diphosphatase HisIE [Flavobacteriales bacterium]
MELKYDSNGLIPAIIQDSQTKTVLMLGYMNQEAIQITKESGWVTFYSRSKQRLWMKGEESGNRLKLAEMKSDCDADALLIKVVPLGPVCHKGTGNCWGEENFDLITYLQTTIEDRLSKGTPDSYIASLFEKGLNKIAQKVGEEAVELVIEAKDNNDELFLNEAADLFFHYMLLLRAKDHSVEDVFEVLKGRVKA